ncbi:MAG: mechanosensitive ion channel family protein [Egibacteraceae bacterium]
MIGGHVMSILAQADVGNQMQGALQATWTNIATFAPKFLGFLAILLIGYLVAKAITKVLDQLLERVGLDRAVERGGIKRALSRSRYDASSLVSKLLFYALMLFVLQLAFGVFGPNPVSDILFGIIAFLPKILVAILIIVVAAAISAAVREIVDSTLGGLSYGRMLASLAGGVILAIGVFAALNQIEIAPEIINGLFYAILAIIAGSAIVAIGGGGIMPMRHKWEQYLSRIEAEGPRMREEIRSTSTADLEARAERTQQLRPDDDEQPPPPVDDRPPEDAIRDAGQSRRPSTS